MGSNTPNGYPYPVGTDRVMDGDDAIAALANAVDTKLGVSAAGTAPVTIGTAAVSGSAAVTFPAGRFTAPPVVSLTTGTNSSVWVPGAAANITASSFTAFVMRNDPGSTGVITAFPLLWIARSAG